MGAKGICILQWKPKTCMAANGTSRRFSLALLGMLVLSVFLLLFSLGVGYYDLPIWEVVPALFGKDTTQMQVLMGIRLPRILAGFLIGAALAVSGSAYQGMFKNPLVSPDILGVSAGAGLGAALAITVGLPYYWVQIAAFVFGILFVLICYLVAGRVSVGQTVSLILAGTMMQTLANALTTMLKYVADPNDTLPSITFWLMGSLRKVDMDALRFAWPPMALGFAILLLMRYRFNVLSLGDDEARSIGIEPSHVRAIAIVGATLLSASAVCLGGLIGFVGLMIPHIARWLVGPQYGRLLPISCLMGGCFLLVMDDIARASMTMELPLGVMTAVVGAPFFLYLVVRQGRDGR